MKITVTAWFVIVAAVCFAFFGFFPTHPKYLFLLGWTMLACAYFVVLWRSYQKKTAIFTRGGFVQYEKRTLLYKLIYLLLVFVGIMIISVLIIDWIYY